MDLLKRLFWGKYRFYAISTGSMLIWMFFLDTNDLTVQYRLWNELSSMKSEKAFYQQKLKELEKELIKAGSSMEKVLKVNVYLADLNDYKQMNEVYKGRFGANPPVRTTVATYGGVPGNSLVEMDCIAIAN